MQKIKKLSKKTRSDFITYGIIIVAFAILEPLRAFGMLSSSFSGQLVPICTYIIMAVSLNLNVGILGELSLGHAGFMSIGAFVGITVSTCLNGSIESGIVRLLCAIVIGGIFAGVSGFIIGIPVLRLRGDYLAIVTLAFGEIIKNIINCLYVGFDSNGLHFSMENAQALEMNGGKVIINGPMGAVGVEKLSTFSIGFIFVMITLIVVQNMIRSRTGRAVMAIRDNRIAAESVGISVTKYKLIAFITSAVLAGMSGALYAMNYTTLIAKKFDFNTSILVLVFVVLGGMGNIRGSIIATTILYMLPEVLREFEDYRMLIYAIILIVVMLVTNSERAKNILEIIETKISKFTNKKQADAEKEDKREDAVNE